MQSTAPTLSSSYSVITELIRTQKLALSFVFGPPRGGTTAAERWLFESFAFDANVNQPGLLARDETGSRERVEATWNTVLRKYMEVFDPKAAGKTIRIIVKETSNVVLPNSEVRTKSEKADGSVAVGVLGGIGGFNLNSN